MVGLCFNKKKDIGCSYISIEEYKIMNLRLTQAPKDKFRIPQTSAQEYGWDSTPLVHLSFFLCLGLVFKVDSIYINR